MDKQKIPCILCNPMANIHLCIHLNAVLVKQKHYIEKKYLKTDTEGKWLGEDDPYH